MAEEFSEKKISMAQQVEEMLRKQQENKVFKDSDIRIQGSRKEMAAIAKIKRMSLQELVSLGDTDLSEYAIGTLVKKDKVFPEFIPAEQKEAGVSSGAAYLKIKLRDAYPAKPTIPGMLSMRVYTGFAEYLFSKMKDIPTISELEKFTVVEFANDFNENCCAYAYGQNGEWKEVLTGIFETLGFEDILPWRKEFESFTEFKPAYDYHKEYFYKLTGLLKKGIELNYARLVDNYNYEKWGIYSYSSPIKTDIDYHNEEQRETLYKQMELYLHNYISSPDRDTINHIYNLVVYYKALSKHYGILKQYGGGFSNVPKYDVMFQFLSGMLELREESKYSVKKFGIKEPINYSRFVKLFFSSRFYNMLHSQYYGYKAAYEEHQKAVYYDGVTPEQSAAYSQGPLAFSVSQLEILQRKYTAVADVKFVEEMDKLMASENNEEKPAEYGFYFQHRKPNGRVVLDHAYYSKLTNKDDKWEWIKRWLQTTEKEITEQAEKIEKDKQENAPRAQDWSWAFGSGEAKADSGEEAESTQNGKLRPHSNPILTHIQRIGGLSINWSMLESPETIAAYMKNTFGFKAFEYGASLKDSEAKEIIYHFLGAVSDLADILDIDLFSINRQAGLNMGFASRGGGNFKAKYTPAYRMVSITKSMGDGSIAHEFAHYIDNIVPLLDHPGSYNFRQFATEKNDTERWLAGKLQNPEVALCFLEIMTYIQTGKRMEKTDNGIGLNTDKQLLPSTVEYVADAERAGNRRLVSWIVKAGKTPEALKDYPAQLLFGQSRWKYYEDFSRSDLVVFDIACRDAGLKTFTFSIPSKRSFYYTESLKAGGDYWVRNTELFARAFEVYVFDKLKAAGRYNNYLCSGSYEEEHADYQPLHPYPQFEQRQYLFYLFEKLIAAIKRAYDISGFIPFTTNKNTATVTEFDIEAKEQLSLEDKLKNLLQLIQKS